MKTLRSIFSGVALLSLPAEAQEHPFENDPVVTVRENFVACDVLSQLQRVMDNPRFLLRGECDPLRAGDRVRVYARRGLYVCQEHHDRICLCWPRHIFPRQGMCPAFGSGDLAASTVLKHASIAITRMTTTCLLTAR